MDIYSITSDYENYRFLVFKNDSFAEKALDFTGNCLGLEWSPIEAQLFCDPRKKKDSRLLTFDASCYHGGQLWIKVWVAELFKLHYEDLFEFLPITTNTEQQFVFANLLKKLPSLKQPHASVSDLMKMVRYNSLDFDLNVVEGAFLFRDQIFNSDYFCTDVFVDFVKKHNITGLKFVKKGVAK